LPQKRAAQGVAQFTHGLLVAALYDHGAETVLEDFLQNDDFAYRIRTPYGDDALRLVESNLRPDANIIGIDAHAECDTDLEPSGPHVNRAVLVERRHYPVRSWRRRQLFYLDTKGDNLLSCFAQDEFEAFVSRPQLLVLFRTKWLRTLRNPFRMTAQMIDHDPQTSDTCDSFGKPEFERESCFDGQAGVIYIRLSCARLFAGRGCENRSFQYRQLTASDGRIEKEYTT
jgi:hypothetical protein